MTQSIGQKLKQAREEQRITLENASESTRIRVPYLQALEAGDMSTLPSPVQARGFLRNYAEYLGLDFDQMIDELRAESTSLDEIIGPADHIRNQHRRDVFLGQSASREDRLDHRIKRAHRGIAHADFLALQVRDGLHTGVLAHPESAAQRMQRADQADVRARLLGGLDLEDVGDAELGFAAADQRDQD